MPPHPSDRANDNRRTAGLAAIVLGILALLWTVDVVMARAERSEMQEQAHGDWSDGMRLLADGHAVAAEDMLRKAHAIDRNNAAYGLDLATALTAAGKFDDAAALIDDLLKASPNDGATNLAAARLSVRRGALEDAKAYYHRAIYGAWAMDPRQHRIETRMELSTLLDSNGAATELLAELLPLEPEVQGDPALEKKVAALYLDAHSPARAAAAYRAILAEDEASGVDDAGVYSGLGQAELQLADYSAAESDFRAALRREPNDAGLRQQLGLAADMASLDPTLRRLTSRVKYERSLKLLELARDSFTRCAPPDRVAADIDVDEANRLLKKNATARPASASVTNEAAEDLLGLAGRIWRVRLSDCREPLPPEEEPVSRIMASLSK